MFFVHPHSAIKQLGLTEDKNLVEIELELPWDPLSISRTNAWSFQAAEKMLTGEFMSNIYSYCKVALKSSLVQTNMCPTDAQLQLTTVIC
jgi:hypothetical protein